MNRSFFLRAALGLFAGLVLGTPSQAGLTFPVPYTYSVHQTGGPTLTATPVGTSVFGGWTGGCTGGTCTIVLQSDTTATATFN